MLLNRRVLASLLCAGLSVACAALTLRAAAEGRAAGRELISEGFGIRGVYLWRSTADDVAAANGKDFALIEHGVYSYEMRYVTQGLSFWYCRSDPRKRIFDIECRAPFDGFTARGIILGESTLREVFRAYGKADPGTSSSRDHWSFSYPGIEFSIAYKDIGNKPVSALHSMKITAIDVVTDESGSDCIAPNLK